MGVNYLPTFFEVFLLNVAWGAHDAKSTNEDAGLFDEAAMKEAFRSVLASGKRQPFPNVGACCTMGGSRNGDSRRKRGHVLHHVDKEPLAKQAPAKQHSSHKGYDNLQSASIDAASTAKSRVYKVEEVCLAGCAGVSEVIAMLNQIVIECQNAEMPQSFRAQLICARVESVAAALSRLPPNSAWRHLVSHLKDDIRKM